MIEGGGGARFAAETVNGLRVLRNAVGQKFQSNAAAEARVPRFVDYTHAPASEPIEDLVVSDGAANQGLGVHSRPLILGLSDKQVKRDRG